MAKRNKGSGPAATPNLRPDAARHPEKRPTLLAVSLVLFALWFTFLLVTALAD
jgi:hypothetical protein